MGQHPAYPKMGGVRAGGGIRGAGRDTTGGLKAAAQRPLGGCGGWGG